MKFKLLTSTSASDEFPSAHEKQVTAEIISVGF
jgi:hypothetical protein